MKLDVSRLPREALYEGNGDRINLASIVWDMRTTIDEWARIGRIKQNDSFGFAMARPESSAHWDDPYQFIWFVVGWGPEGDRYIANAVRKLRSSLRCESKGCEIRDTLDLRLHATELFIDKVESQEMDGSFEWGDFPWGGATFVHVGDLVLPSAVSALKEVEDDATAKTFGGHIGATMLKLRNPELFA